MVQLDRRTFLKGAAATAGAAALQRPVPGLRLASRARRARSPRSATSARRRRARRRRPTLSARGLPLPLVPRHDRPGRPRPTARSCPAGTTAWPPSPGRGGNSVLIRNHEVNGPLSPALRAGGASTYDPMTAAAARRPSRSRGTGEVDDGLHEPQRHADELRRRPHAVGRLDHLRGDRQRPRRRARLHGRLQSPADAAPRLHLRGARSTGTPDAEPITPGRAASPTKPPRSTPASGVLYLTEDNFGVPVRLLPLPARRRIRWTPARSTDGGQLQMLAVDGICRTPTLPRASADGRPTRSVGRHRRARADVPVHARRRRHPQRTTTAHQYVGSQGRAAGRRAASPASRAPRTTMASCTSPRPRAAAPRRPAPTPHRPRLGQRLRARSGPTRSTSRSCSCVYQSPGPRRPRLPGQRHDQPARHDHPVRGRTATTTTSAASPRRSALEHRPQSDGRALSATSSPARRSAPTARRCS